MCVCYYCTDLIRREHAQRRAHLHAQPTDAADHLQHTLPLAGAHLCVCVGVRACATVCVWTTRTHTYIHNTHVSGMCHQCSCVFTVNTCDGLHPTQPTQRAPVVAAYMPIALVHCTIRCVMRIESESSQARALLYIRWVWITDHASSVP